ncbi:MAG: hypothetical protein V4581_15715 [Bacteroidota bacterium]
MYSTTGIPPLGVRGPKHLNRRIRRIEAEIANITTLPYYHIFNREDERAADLAEAEQRLKALQVMGCQ